VRLVIRLRRLTGITHEIWWPPQNIVAGGFYVIGGAIGIMIGLYQLPSLY
jgi:hypothetical protein